MSQDLAASPSDARGSSSRLVRLVTTPVGAGLVLLVAYVALSYLCSPSGFLGTDTGIKIGTYETMKAQGTWRPAIGYWAHDIDPDAVAHPFYGTTVINDELVDVTTLPMVLTAYPLWRVGGYRLALLLPMAGAIACAFIARGFARRVKGGDGWLAFWLTGLASPLTVYALDLWEHTLGVAAMAGGALVVYDAIDRPRWWRGLVAGALFGLAFSMRTEAVVYLVTSFGLIGVVLATKRSWLQGFVLGVGGLMSFGVLMFANTALEVAAFGSPIRSGRAAGSVSEGGSAVWLRVQEAVVTTTSPFASMDGMILIVSVVGAVALVLAAYWSSSRKTLRYACYAAVGAGTVVLVRVTGGFGFVPGLLFATPLAAVGLARGWRDAESRIALALALVPVPLVIMFQYLGGALPQWGGRYLLTSGLLLATVGIAHIGELDRRFSRGFVVLAVVVTLAGVGWLSVRSHSVGNSLDAIQSLPEAVIIFPDSFVSREFAAGYDQGSARWLATTKPGDLEPAFSVLRTSDAPTVALLELTSPGDPDPPVVPIEGFHKTGRTTIPFIDPFTFTVTTYARDST